MTEKLEELYQLEVNGSLYNSTLNMLAISNFFEIAFELPKLK